MMITYLLFFISVACVVAGELLLKKGMLIVGPLEFSLSNTWLLIVTILKNPYLFLGLFLYTISVPFWLFVLSKAKLSLAYPIFTGLVYSSVILFSWIFFKEHLTTTQYVGLTIILIGLLFLLKS